MTDNKKLLVLVKSSSFGEGEPDLGEKLLKSFLQMLLESDAVPGRIVFMNSGIFLTTEGSPVVEIIREFESNGAEILSCKTCLDYFGRHNKLRVGHPTNMKDTVEAMLDYERIISI